MGLLSRGGRRITKVCGIKLDEKRQNLLAFSSGVLATDLLEQIEEKHIY